MSAGGAEKERIETTETSFEIPEKLRELDGARVTTLATPLGLARSTIHRYLEPVRDLEYVTRDEDAYKISLKFLQLGEHTRNREKEYKMVKSKVDELTEQIDERAQLIVEEHDNAVYIHYTSGIRVEAPQ